MQSYDFKLDPTVLRTRTIFNDADLFVYESGVTTPINGETRILVTPENGAQIVLRPGQRFRITKQVNAWTIQPYDPAATLSGSIIIGSGEFDDANTLNKVTLDATFANQVTVTNTTAQRLPVSLDLAQRMPVSLDLTQLVKLDPSTIINVAGTTVQYTNSYADATTGTLAAGVIFTAAANVNGAYIEFAEVAVASVSPSGVALVTLIAKATAPASAVDGDVVMLAAAGGSSGNPGAEVKTIALNTRIKIAAGKGLWLNQNANVVTANKTVLYTLL